MGLFTNALVEALRPQNKVTLPIGAPTYPMIDLKTGEKKYAAGTDDAYFSNAFRACLLAKARPLASLPVDVYTRDEGTRVKAKSRVAKDLSRILRERWNPVLSSAEGIRWLIMTKDTLGNAFLRVQWEKGRPVALWPLRMEAKPTVLPSGEVAFDYAGDKFTPEGRYLAYEIVWVKSPVLDADGYKGVSLADLAARELGLSIDLEEFYEKLVTNGNHFPGWLETDQTLGDQGVAALEKQLADKRGIVSAGKLRIFDKGLKYHTTPLTMADMSLVEQERWILQQTCRTLSVPPQEVFDLSNSTYSNIEQGALNFANKTLVPECKLLEQAFTGILRAVGNMDDYIQFDMNGLMRGDYKNRMDGYRIGLYAKFLNPNEVRAFEDLPPYEGGEMFLQPVSYSLVDPETGEIVQMEQRVPPTTTAPEPGGSGEGTVQTTGEPVGNPEGANPLSPIYSDMEARVLARFREKGDTQATRDFATRVLEPYANACILASELYDITEDIDRISKEATNG